MGINVFTDEQIGLMAACVRQQIKNVERGLRTVEQADEHIEKMGVRIKKWWMDENPFASTEMKREVDSIIDTWKRGAKLLVRSSYENGGVAQ